MRMLITTVLVGIVTACGQSETAQPTATTDQGVEYWSETLAQSLLREDGTCQLADHPKRLGIDLQQVPGEVANAVSNRVIEKIQAICAGRAPITQPDCGWTCYIEPSPSN